jgi:hypothetical protein
MVKPDALVLGFGLLLAGFALEQFPHFGEIRLQVFPAFKQFAAYFPQRPVYGEKRDSPKQSQRY